MGFKIDEVMTGTHRFINSAGPEGVHPLHYSLTWGTTRLGAYLNPFSGEFLENQAKGVITAGGLVEKADCTGTLSMLYFTEAKIRYDLYFHDANGKPYRYIGEKRNIRPWNLHKTHVTCYGVILDMETNTQVSESVVYFPFREMLAFTLSFRPRWKTLYKYA